MVSVFFNSSSNKAVVEAVEVFKDGVTFGEEDYDCFNISQIG